MQNKLSCGKEEFMTQTKPKMHGKKDARVPDRRYVILLWGHAPAHKALLANLVVLAKKTQKACP